MSQLKKATDKNEWICDICDKCPDSCCRPDEIVEMFIVQNTDIAICTACLNARQE